MLTEIYDSVPKDVYFHFQQHFNILYSIKINILEKLKWTSEII